MNGGCESLKFVFIDFRQVMSVEIEFIEVCPFNVAQLRGSRVARLVNFRNAMGGVIRVDGSLTDLAFLSFFPVRAVTVSFLCCLRRLW